RRGVRVVEAGRRVLADEGDAGDPDVLVTLVVGPQRGVVLGRSVDDTGEPLAVTGDRDAVDDAPDMALAGVRAVDVGEQRARLGQPVRARRDDQDLLRYRTGDRVGLVRGEDLGGGGPEGVVARGGAGRVRVLTEHGD